MLNSMFEKVVFTALAGLISFLVYINSQISSLVEIQKDISHMQATLADNKQMIKLLEVGIQSHSAKLSIIEYRLNDVKNGGYE